MNLTSGRGKKKTEQRYVIATPVCWLTKVVTWVDFIDCDCGVKHDFTWIERASKPVCAGFHSSLGCHCRSFFC